MKKFIFIDGNAIVHRAFHGLPPLNGPSGEQVNAVYGFFSMFLKILQDYAPEMVTVCFDRKAPTFRKEMYVGYQAKRPVMAEGLGPQFDIIRGMLREAKIPISELDGYEADDLIGTLATQIVEKFDGRKLKVEDGNKKVENGVEVIIVSGDRDLLQLVNKQVKMLAPVVGITNMTLFDQQKVEEKYGL
ncbi:MAG: PIN domain-containing protein, partial [Patescibacteria group bacterium]